MMLWVDDCRCSSHACIYMKNLKQGQKYLDLMKDHFYVHGWSF